MRIGSLNVGDAKLVELLNTAWRVAPPVEVSGEHGSAEEVRFAEIVGSIVPVPLRDLFVYCGYRHFELFGVRILQAQVGEDLGCRDAGGHSYAPIVILAMPPGLLSRCAV